VFAGCEGSDDVTRASAEGVVVMPLECEWSAEDGASFVLISVDMIVIAISAMVSSRGSLDDCYQPSSCGV